MDVELNPPGLEATYLEALNVCFPGWGGAAMYRWAFSRQVSGPPTDLLLLRDGGALLAGSAVSYRTVEAPGQPRLLVGIMTGSWTLPAARGRGAFSRIIEASAAATAAHGGGLLLAFVTEQNASFRRLAAVGSALSPTRYVTSRPGARAPTGAPAWEERSADAGCAEAFLAARSSGAHFRYATAAEWAGQFIERPTRPVLVDVPDQGLALVETHGDFDRVQAIAARSDEARAGVVTACLARASSRGKRLFLFEPSPSRADRWWTALELDCAPGHLTSLAASPGAAAPPAAWALDSGDRM